jgi:peptide/nickel transport system substrate-binding protein
MKSIGLVAVRMGAAILVPFVLAAQSAHAQQVNKNGSIVVAVQGEPRALFLPRGGGHDLIVINSKILEKIVRQVNADKFVPELAESWSMSPDGKALTLKLRDTTWHDGKPFTSADIKFTFEEMFRNNSSDPLLQSVASVDTPNPRTAILRFPAPRPEYLVLASLAGPNAQIVAKHVYEGTDFSKNPANRTPIGTGPFKFSKWVAGEYVELVRNENYWDKGLPNLKSITFRYLRDPAARAAAVEAGDVQLAVNSPFPAAELRRIGTKKGLVVDTKGFDTMKWQMLAELNTNNPVLANVEVRKAIAHAIDKKFISDVVYSGFAEPATGPLPKSITKFYTADVPAYQFDPKLAAKLLDQAGYKVKPDGKRFTLNLVVSPFFAENRQAGQYLRQALGDVGIGVNIATPDMGTFVQQIYCNRDFDMTVSNSASGADPLIANAKWYSTTGTKKCTGFANAHGVTSKEMDGIFEKATSETNVQKRRALLEDFQRLAMQQLPIISFVDIKMANVATTKVHNHSYTTQWMYDSWKELWVE